ncbi:hypothetical protein [Streptomyces sp. NPDC002232]|uniref:hypothetical protein n=1 Tax=Streptomyces sp. NPDC002232 TaxID=3364640 RepID=UPI0036B08331
MSASVTSRLDPYARSPRSPLAVGDRVDGETVVGFTFDHAPGTGEPGDRLLVDGDEALAGPPARTVPERADPAVTVDPTGPTPVHDLSEDALRSPPAGLRDGYERAVHSMGEGGVLVAGVLDELARREHAAWLVGGAVRDLLAGGPEAPVRDLDFTGTAGPGELNGLPLWRRRRRDGLGDYDCRVSPRLVWSASPQEFPQNRVMEYRPLNLGGFGFPTYGGGLTVDARTRDLTFNCLYYDHHRNLLADPLGTARAHARAAPPVMAVAFGQGDPVGRARVILRCLKFRLRMPEAEFDHVVHWVGELPNDLVLRIPDESWPLLDADWRAYVPPAHRGPRAAELAASLGPVAKDLVTALLKRAAP